MKISRNFVVASAFFFLISAITASFYTIFTGENIFVPCEADIVSSSPAPDGRAAVIVFGMGCGATTPFNTHASIVPAGEAFSPRKHPAFLVLDGKHELRVHWTALSLVEISLPDETTTFRKEPSVEGIAITYW